MRFSAVATAELLHDLKRANTEAAKKERFLQYLSITFAGFKAAQSAITEFALGAERAIANISRGTGVGRGRADTQTNTVIIEWEKDLQKTGAHAVEQLQEYLTGNWRSGNEYRFVLVATDGIRWRVYAPDWSMLDSGSFSLASTYSLREIKRFDVAEATLEEFPFFIDEVLFGSQPKIATLESIRADFGDTSAVFINSMRALVECADAIQKNPELGVALDQWRRFLSVAYGRFDASPAMFLVHTYLSVFAKLIGHAVVTGRVDSSPSAVRAILDGSAFTQLNVERFVEDDFFHWVYLEPYFTMLRPVFRELNVKITEYNLTEVGEDILKGVYQELIDLETRHALGEYYTPDWLCERIVETLPFRSDSSVLDPACGSGSFLRAVVAKMRRDDSAASASSIARRVVGIDIHPLSVQISKTTMLLALGKLVAKERAPITLHIYLANSLLVPEASADLFAATFTVAVDNQAYTLDVSSVDSPEAFDQLIDFCDDLAKNQDELVPRADFIAASEQALKWAPEKLRADLFNVYRAMKNAVSQGRDTIWKFILQNSYKPVFLRGRFDFVVGNPPWLTYADVSNADYQAMLLSVAEKYKVVPKRADMPHLEIAALFVAHCVNYFLRASGTLAFVLPRSFISASQHENTRRGVVSGTEAIGLWDLVDVGPLFRVPSCVMFFRPRTQEREFRFPEAGLPGLQIRGRLPEAHLHWQAAQQFISAQRTSWHFSTIGTGGGRSALTPGASTSTIGSNAYEKLFTQGATLVPRNFLFVEAPIDAEVTHEQGAVISTRTAEAQAVEAKAPWKEHHLSGRIEGNHLFRSAVAANILPFAMTPPPLVALPAKVVDGTFVMQSSSEMLASGDRFAAKWFQQAERLWETHRTEKNAGNQVTLAAWLDFHGKLTEQNLSVRYLVLYTSSGQNACATVVDRSRIDLPFVVDHKTYWAAFDDRAEADFVTAFINSEFANGLIKDFQSRGLFGQRDIHKLIVKVPFPKFQKSDASHVALSQLGAACAASVGLYLSTIGDQLQDARRLGRVRSAIREQLSDRLDQIDALCEQLSSGRSQAATRKGSRKPRRDRTRSLFLE